MKTELLTDVWYVGIPSAQLKPGTFKTQKICGEPLVFVRTKAGVVYALRDICPHRGIPLSFGRLLGDDMECPYHGWTFSKEGRCTRIPSLCEGDDLDPGKIKIKSYPIREVQGNIWVFLGTEDVAQAPPIPIMECFPEDKLPQFTEIAPFDCHIDHAVIGLMDPAHGPYVHRSWFWRSAASVHEKQKRFGPVDYGFRMLRHQPSKNSRAYKILGGQPTTEITFRLPGVRIEHVLVGNRSFCSFTALTPVDSEHTIITQHAYWDMPWMNFLKPVVRGFAKVFLYQDRDAVMKQQVGLKFNPSLMLIKDADTQAKWYFGLKQEWVDSRQAQRPFRNPVPETTLRWRS